MSEEHKTLISYQCRDGAVVQIEEKNDAPRFRVAEYIGAGRLISSTSHCSDQKIIKIFIESVINRGVG